MRGSGGRLGGGCPCVPATDGKRCRDPVPRGGHPRTCQPSPGVETLPRWGPSLPLLGVQILPGSGTGTLGWVDPPGQRTGWAVGGHHAPTRPRCGLQSPPGSSTHPGATAAGLPRGVQSPEGAPRPWNPPRHPAGCKPRRSPTLWPHAATLSPLGCKPCWGANPSCCQCWGSLDTGQRGNPKFSWLVLYVPLCPQTHPVLHGWGVGCVSAVYFGGCNPFRMHLPTPHPLFPASPNPPF